MPPLRIANNFLQVTSMRCDRPMKNIDYRQIDMLASTYRSR